MNTTKHPAHQHTLGLNTNHEKQKTHKYPDFGVVCVPVCFRLLLATVSGGYLIHGGFANYRERLGCASSLLGWSPLPCNPYGVRVLGLPRISARINGGVV